MNRTAYYLPEHLDAHLEHLSSESFHLFVNGRWTYSFRAPENLLQSYREFAQLGNACSVVVAGEIVFYCLRRIKVGDWVTAGDSRVVGCVKRVARSGRWADVNWHTHTKRMQTRVLTIQHAQAPRRAATTGPKARTEMNEYLFSIEVISLSNRIVLETVTGTVESERYSSASVKAWRIIDDECVRIRQEAGVQVGVGRLHVERAKG
jgi:hypothetical protein